MQFKSYNTLSSIDGRGILNQVESRCTREERNTAYEPDPVTYCHELTHQLNAHLRNDAGSGMNAFFVGQDLGRYILLPEPSITLADVAESVVHFRNEAYELYLVQQQQYWNEQPLNVLDEFSAYVNGSQLALEMKLDNHGSHDRCHWFCYYADCLVKTVWEKDSSYLEYPLLAEFVEWQKNRVVSLLGIATWSTFNG